MKKTVSSILLASMLLSPIISFAENEQHYNHTVTMMVYDSVINVTDEKLFGFGNDWPNYKVYKNKFLDKNYGSSSSFSNDFESKAYTETAPLYKTAYYDNGDTFTYIANGDIYGGNLSFSRYMVKSNSNLYDGIYDENGNLTAPSFAVGENIETPDNSSCFKNVNRDNLISGGIDGYVGFNSLFELAKGDYKRTDIEDLTVVADPSDSTNHVAKLSPAGGNWWYGRDSFFGKNDIAIIDRKTKFTYRIKISSDEADSRLAVTKQLDMQNIKTVADENKRVHTGALAYFKINNEYEDRGWFDALRFKNGEVFLAGNNVGGYEKDKWYTVEYTLDIKHGEHYENALTLTDDDGNVVISTEAAISLNPETNMGHDCYFVNNHVPKDFTFAERSYYGLLMTAHTKHDSSKENTVVYIDDLNFETLEYYDDKDAVINEKMSSLRDNNTFSFSRIGGVTSTNFSWKEGLGAADERKYLLRAKGTNTGRRLPEYFAIPEWLKMVDYLNPEAKLAYTINLNDSDKDIIDLIEFLTADGDINNDGEDWAQIRRDNGIENPARLYMWEIGNEPNINYQDPGTWKKHWDVDSYLKRAGEIIEILKKYSPENINIAVALNTDYVANVDSGKAEKNWDRRFLNLNLSSNEEFWNYASDVDYFAIHAYDRLSAGRVIVVLDDVKANIASSEYPGIKIAYTEQATNLPLLDGAQSYDGLGLASVLYESMFFNRIMREPIVDVACVWSYDISSSMWGIGYEHEGELKANATLKLIDMYANNAIGKVLDTTITGFKVTSGSAGWDGWNHRTGTWNNGKYGYSPAAVLQDDGTLNLFISNARNHTLTLNLVLDEVFDGYSIVEKQVITGANLDDTIFSYEGYAQFYNEATGLRDLFIYNNDMKYYTEYDLPINNVKIDPYSVTMLKLKKNKIKAELTSVDGVQYVDVSGRYNVVSDKDKLVSLYITDKEKNDILYIREGIIDEENKYRFHFKFDKNPADCIVLINLNGNVYDITNEFAINSDKAE